MNADNSKSKEPQNSQVETFRNSIFSHFSQVEDQRDSNKPIKHELLNVLFITLCAVLCSANNLKEVAAYAKRRKKWLESILNLPNGVPCYNTFWWIFLLLDPKQLNDGFVSWVQSITELSGRKVIAIDGKALRGTASKSKPNSFVHMVSMWAADTGLTLAQTKVDDKSNEITAIPKLIEMINVDGAVITIDAMGTQTAIAKQIIDNNADYLLALKGNQSSLHDEVENFFDQAEAVDFDDVKHSAYHTTEEGHGRYEERHIYSTEDIEWFYRSKKGGSGQALNQLLSSYRYASWMAKKVLKGDYIFQAYLQILIELRALYVHTGELRPVIGCLMWLLRKMSRSPEPVILQKTCQCYGELP